MVLDVYMMTSLWVWIIEEENRNTWSDFADEPNGSPNGGRIVCARLRLVREPRWGDAGAAAAWHATCAWACVSLLQDTLLLCKSYKHLDTLGFGAVLASYLLSFSFFLINWPGPIFGDYNLINMGLILVWKIWTHINLFFLIKKFLVNFLIFNHKHGLG